MPIKAKSFHQRSASQARPVLRPTSAARGYDANWRRVRVAFLRAHPFCCFCMRPATIADHITPLIQGGKRLDAANLRAVCTDCHAIITGNLKRTGRNEMPGGRA
jgi:5-methylcytosine-specific restriction endonuclease McrA